MRHILTLIAVIVLSTVNAFAGADGMLPLFNVPTLNEWGMIAAAVGLCVIGILYVVKQRKATG